MKPAGTEPGVNDPDPDRPILGAMTIVGWRELVRLPDLDTRAFRAKFDTGARTSALHAEDIEEVSENGIRMVRFSIDRPRVKNDVRRTVAVADYRPVTSSNGEEEMRFVIETDFQIGDHHYLIELTLTRRGDMRYPMLVGRKALAGRLLIDPAQSYLHGTPEKVDRKRRREGKTQ